MEENRNKVKKHNPTIFFSLSHNSHFYWLFIFEKNIFCEAGRLHFLVVKHKLKL